MILDMLVVITNFLFLLGVTIIIHEIAHKAYLDTVLKKDIKLRFFYHSWRDFGMLAGKQEDYDALTNAQYYYVNIIAVGVGILVICVATMLSHYWLYLLLLLPYLTMVRQDIVEAWRTWWKFV